MKTVAEPQGWTTGNPALDLAVQNVLGGIVASMSERLGITIPEAKGLLHVALTFDIAASAPSGLPYLEASQAWMTLVNNPQASDADIDAIEDERQRRFERWKTEAKARLKTEDQPQTHGEDDAEEAEDDHR